MYTTTRRMTKINKLHIISTFIDYSVLIFKSIFGRFFIQENSFEVVFEFVLLSRSRTTRGVTGDDRTAAIIVGNVAFPAGYRTRNIRPLCLHVRSPFDRAHFLFFQRVRSRLLYTI